LAISADGIHEVSGSIPLGSTMWHLAYLRPLIRVQDYWAITGLPVFGQRLLCPDVLSKTPSRHDCRHFAAALEIDRHVCPSSGALRLFPPQHCEDLAHLAVIFSGVRLVLAKRQLAMVMKDAPSWSHARLAREWLDKPSPNLRR
jgi:hypothetical protein